MFVQVLSVTHQELGPRVPTSPQSVGETFKHLLLLLTRAVSWEKYVRITHSLHWFQWFYTSVTVVSNKQSVSLKCVICVLFMFRCDKENVCRVSL